MGNKAERFDTAIKDKRIPVLTIDKKYLNLVEAIGHTDKMEGYENELNDLLKAQGKANTEIKELKKLKKRLMQEIVDNTDENLNISEDEKLKKAEENKRLIQDCNEKIDQYEEDILDLPKEIDSVNKNLMLELMDASYELMKNNEAEINKTAKWITQVRIELKKRLVQKQDMETKNQQIYAYMHDIFGPEVIELFDMKYKDVNGDEKK